MTASCLMVASSCPKMALEVATYNINAWSSFKDKLGELSCHVVLLQEHRLALDQIPAASSFCLRRGWKSIWSPATSTQAGGKSGGTAVLARAGLGLRGLLGLGCEEFDLGSRGAVAIVEAPGYPAILMASLYLTVSVGIVSTKNVELLEIMGGILSRCSMDYMIGPATY